MRTFAQIIADFAATAPPRSTTRSKLREMFNRLLFDSTPVVANTTERASVYPSPAGDEKVYNKATDADERYDATASKWVTMQRRSELVGTEDPNPSGNTFFGYPKVALSPPTITDWGVDDGIGSIAGGFKYSPIAGGVVNLNAPWRYLCAQIQKVGGDHVNANSVRGQDGTGGFYAVEFMYDARKFELVLTCHGPVQSGWRVLVNNEFVGGPTGAGETLQAGTQANVTHRLLFDFGSSAIRSIRIELSSDITFKGIAVEATSSAWRPETVVGPMVMCVGDSFVSGSDGTNPPVNFLNILGKLMGWRNVWSDAEGGTGYLTTAAFGVTYADRIEIDVIPRKPDIVIVEGGRNDLNAFSASAIATAAGTLFARLRTTLPQAKLICVAPYKLTGSPDQAAIDTRNAVRTAVLGLADLFIDPIVATSAGANTLGWFTAGNLVNYLYSDGVHPTVSGSKYMGFRLASEIVARMPF